MIKMFLFSVQHLNNFPKYLIDSQNQLAKRCHSSVRSSPSLVAENRPCSGAQDVPKNMGIAFRGFPSCFTDACVKDGLYHQNKKFGKVTSVDIVGTGEEKYAVVTFLKWVFQLWANLDSCVYSWMWLWNEWLGMWMWSQKKYLASVCSGNILVTTTSDCVSGHPGSNPLCNIRLDHCSA